MITGDRFVSLTAVTDAPDTGPSSRRMARARLVTILAIVGGVLFSLVMTGVGLTFADGPLWIVLGSVGVLGFAAGLAGALYRAITPGLGASTDRRLLAGFAAASVLSLPLVGPVGADQWQTWAFLSSAIVGWAPLLLRRVGAAVIVMVATTAVSAAAAWWFGGSVGGYVVITAGLGLSVAVWNGLHLWGWRFLVRVQEGREALTKLATTEERLRFARDIHDLLGHNLSAIALKAELASRLAPLDAQRAGREADEVRRLAASTLTEMREVVHGYREVDLGDQVDAVAQVLRSSGVRCTVSRPDAGLSADAAASLVAVLREGSTNVMRHSHAQWCTIDVVHEGGEARMTIVNDGVGGGRPDRYSYGLRGLSDRLRDAGGELHTWERDGMFTLEATVRSTT
ncbi:MAG: sensor histidine kinase [Actinophytocola sp.]|uniref:sensor histidine kinase n=1 Tax=Actinophytocola sp. TaxID=1872138 RepID=UPI003D6AADDA